MFYFKPILILLLVLLSSCGQGTKQSVKIQQFPVVTVPSIIGSQQEAIEWMAKNYWNKFLDTTQTFSTDTSLVGNIPRDDFRKHFMEYSQILWSTAPKIGVEAQYRFINKAISVESKYPKTNILENILELSELYLYDVNSPLRNEEFFLPIADVLSKSELSDDITKEKYNKIFSDCSINRVGEIATNFTFSTKSGKSSRLHDIKSDYVFLFFSNPGCSACLEIIKAIIHSEKINGLINSKKLSILNLYIDENLGEWIKYMEIYPTTWINAYNPNIEITSQELYSIRAIPTIYILDKNKRVILKDAPQNIALNFVESLD